MIDLLNVPNPDKKIDKIVSEAIEGKEKEIKEANKVLDNLKQQEKDGVYYSPIDTNLRPADTEFLGGLMDMNISQHNHPHRKGRLRTQ